VHFGAPSEEAAIVLPSVAVEGFSHFPEFFIYVAKGLNGGDASCDVFKVNISVDVAEQSSLHELEGIQEASESEGSWVLEYFDENYLNCSVDAEDDLSS